MMLSCSKMREFSSLPSASIIPEETLPKVSDMIAISMFNIIKGMKIEENMKSIHYDVEYSSTLKSPYISKYIC